MSSNLIGLDEPAIWVGCLSCYNNGRLNGKWITAERAANEREPGSLETLGGLATVETVGDYTARRCVVCFGDEFDVMDHQLIPKSCANIADFYENAEHLFNLHHTGTGLEHILILASVLDPGGTMSLDELSHYHDENYIGAISLNEFIDAEIEDGCWEHGSLPDHYIDREAIARDYRANGTFIEEDGYLWRSC